MTAKRRTKFQMTHPPVRVTENFCPDTALDDRGRCITCGRVLSRRVPHKPNTDGQFGWTEHYADGTTRQKEN
jgi:hypothetical protein